MRNKDDLLPIELKPYTALEILKFLREFDYSTDNELASLGEAVKEFEDEICKNIRNDQIEDAVAESKVKELLGLRP